MKGIADLYFSYIYKSRSSALGNLFLFYVVVLYMMCYSIYYANIVHLWFDDNLKDYTDYIFYYIISFIFHIYELLFKGITLYATYFPSISIYRLEGGLLVIDNLRGIVGSPFKAENNTFLQRSYPKPHFTFLALYFFFFLLRRTVIVLKLFVKKPHNVFFFKFVTICRLYFIFIVTIMLCVFFSEYQLNGYIFTFYNFYKLIADFFFANFIEINERFLCEILSNKVNKEFKAYYIFYLDLIFSTNETIWYNVTTITYNTNIFFKYILYVFCIMFKYIFSLIFLISSIIYYIFHRIYFLNPIFLELPEFFFKIITTHFKKTIFDASFDFTEKMLQTCMNIYSEKESAQYVKKNPFRDTLLKRRTFIKNNDILLYIKPSNLLRADYRNRISGSFRFSLKRLRINSLNKECYYFFLKDTTIKRSIPYNKTISHQKKVHEGRIWQMAVDKSNYNLLYFYNQTARTSTGKKTTLRVMLDNITKKLIYETYFYEHLMSEIKLYESIFTCDILELEDRNYFNVNKTECEAIHLLVRILYQDEVFFKRKIQQKQLFPSIAFWYNKILTEMIRNLYYEFDWWYFIRTGRLHFYRHWRIKRSMKRKIRLYYFEEGPVIRTFLKKHPKRRVFKILQNDILDLRKLINGLYDSTGIMHIEAINTLFNGHFKNTQMASYFVLKKRSSLLLQAFHERIFKEIIYGYQVKHNKIYNPFKYKYLYLKKIDYALISDESYIKHLYRLWFLKKDFEVFDKRLYREIEISKQWTLMSTTDRYKIGYARKLKRFSDYLDKRTYLEKYKK